jgi:hypothetical protein
MRQRYNESGDYVLRQLTNGVQEALSEALKYSLTDFKDCYSPQ